MIEDSIQFLLEAQADYWREMIALNGSRVTKRALAHMQKELTACEQELGARGMGGLTLVACG